MLKSIILSFALCGSLVIGGCAKSNAPTPPLAPGYQNAVDQSMGETLAAARAFYMRLQQDATAGTYKPSATERTVISNLGNAINVAEPLYLAYHAGTGSQASAQSAINSVTQAQAAVQSTISSTGVN